MRITFRPDESVIDYSVPTKGHCTGKLEFLSEDHESVTFREHLTVGNCTEDRFVLSLADDDTLSYSEPDSSVKVFGVALSIKGTLRRTR